MNLFLLLCAPLFTIIFSRFMMPKVDFSLLWKGLLGGFFTSALIFALFWVFRDGWLISWDLLGLFTHQLVGEYLIFLLPMAVFFLLWGTKGSTDQDFLTSGFGWFAGLFILMGLRDFYVTMPGFDDTQLFLLPILRIDFMILTPVLLLSFHHSGALGGRVVWGLAGLGVSSLGAALITARLLGYVLPVWVVTLGLGALVFLWGRRRYA